MRKLFLIVALMPTCAFSGVISEPMPPARDYAALKYAFTSDASLPARDEAVGWFAGRCFLRDAPDRETPQLLAGTSGADGGPFKVMSFSDFGRPDVFDRLTRDLAQDINGRITFHWGEFTDAREKNSSLVSDQGVFESRLRKSGEWLVEEKALLRSSSGDGLPAGSAFAYCLFPKKLWAGENLPDPALYPSAP